ncbi:MAG TPA: hypothetical protein VGU70_16330 [Methylobacterium sp.]|jgi:hypothetical protein|uniref:hypothetical protein n=1 Tax=Methylorubrum sp. B1-46 TaxID=2897334 RepID=UPI001E4A1C2E|nr:hypothetical protein [Methylorubrum sp. B1-46]UGB25137.1 hypothetical protein LPC10_19865 [Methylorubrum sp. B1-46]HEV2544324.1 hypothetical protein [Methylobacterium sp.]
MTIDKQPDRTSAPLAFVSDQNYPENLDHAPDQPVADEQDTAERHQKATVSPTNAFEGFGSFSG